MVPGVTPHAIAAHSGIIANPNCSTIGIVVVLKPIHDAAKERASACVVVTRPNPCGTGKRP